MTRARLAFSAAAVGCALLVGCGSRLRESDALEQLRRRYGPHLEKRLQHGVAHIYLPVTWNAQDPSPTLCPGGAERCEAEFYDYLLAQGFITGPVTVGGRIGYIPAARPGVTPVYNEAGQPSSMDVDLTSMKVTFTRVISIKKDTPTRDLVRIESVEEQIPTEVSKTIATACDKITQGGPLFAACSSARSAMRPDKQTHTIEYIFNLKQGKWVADLGTQVPE
jgi:hypothetical protein